ncbi:MAG: putative Ig domain-containing protein, partial [Flavobacteriales bacterium]
LNLTGSSVTITAPTGCLVSEDNVSFGTSITVNHNSGSFTNKTIYVRFTPAALGSYSDNVVISDGGLSSSVLVALTGTGVNSVAGLSYTTSTATYCSGNAITANNAALSVTGGIVSYTISPSLPTGLSLNSSTGAISGTPTTGTAQSNYVVTATNGCSNATSTISIEVLTSPTAPTSSAGTGATPNSFTANWGTVATATNYLLDVSTSSTFASFVTIYNGLNVGNVLSYNVTGLGSATTYYYRVRAVNGSCISANSLSQTIATTALTTISSGDWNSGSTRNGGLVPTCIDNITIAAGHTVTVNSAGNVS